VKVFVTGSEGWLGGVLSEKLVEVGHEVIPYDTKIDPACDINDMNRVQSSAVGCTAAVLCAAIPWGDPDKDLNDFYLTNVMGAWSSMKGVIHAGVQRIIYISSSAVYGLEPHLYNEIEPERKEEILEDESGISLDLGMPAGKDVWPSLFSYMQSKIVAEHMVGWLAAVHGRRTVILRSGPFGDTDPAVFGGTKTPPELLVSAIIRSIELEDDEFEYFDQLTGYATFAPVLLCNITQPGGVLDIGRAESYGLLDPR
jgi:nucleoside-diphosphate-sugar epimerase